MGGHGHQRGYSTGGGGDAVAGWTRRGRVGAGPPAALELRARDRIVLVGNTLAERMQLFNHFETLLATRFPDLQLTVRNLGWSGDTVALQPRPLNFGTTPTHLYRQKADVILAFFGLNESFDGQAGLGTVRAGSDRLSPREPCRAVQRHQRTTPGAGVAHRARAAGAADARGRGRPQPRAGPVHRGHGPRRRAARRAVCRSVHADACADGAGRSGADHQRHSSQRGRRSHRRATPDGGARLRKGPAAGDQRRDAPARRRSARPSATRTSSSSIAGVPSTPNTSSGAAWSRSDRSISRAR